MYSVVVCICCQVSYIGAVQIELILVQTGTCRLLHQELAVTVVYPTYVAATDNAPGYIQLYSLVVYTSIVL